jgi:restriction system protein
MRPLLELASDGSDHSLREAHETLADKFDLSSEERKALLPSGRQSVFVNRIAWAKTNLQRAGILDSPRRGVFRITDRGRASIKDAPQRITVKYLGRYPEFLEFRSARTKSKDTHPIVVPEEEGETPEEVLEAAHSRLRTDLASDLLLRIKACSPEFFERLVVELLLAMGYGGSRKEAGEAIGGTGDEGIDGLINEDRLGLDTIYLQAKRWEGTVGRPEIQRFVGALHGKRAKKGVFMTTGAFSAESSDYVRNIDPKVILIDGRQLAEFMIDFNVGVTPSTSYEVKKVDSDYFDEE